MLADVPGRLQAAYIVLVVLLLLYMLVSIRLMTQYNLAYTWVITAIFIALTLIDIILGTYVPAFAVPSVYARSYLLGAFLFVQVITTSP